MWKVESGLVEVLHVLPKKDWFSREPLAFEE
jgi:hypothetical protein